MELWTRTFILYLGKTTFRVIGNAGEKHYFTLNNYLILCNLAKILQSFPRN